MTFELGIVQAASILGNSGAFAQGNCPSERLTPIHRGSFASKADSEKVAQLIEGSVPGQRVQQGARQID